MRMNIGQFVAKRAALRPEQEAIFDVGKGSRLSYPEPGRCRQPLAHRVPSQGRAPGDRVATLYGLVAVFARRKA